MIIDREYNVLAGHGRIMAAKEEGIAEVPCVFVDHMTEAQKKAYILADNRMALDAGWDDELLAVEMEELQNLGFDLGLTGFYYPLFQFIHFNASRQSKLKASKVSRGEAKVI